MSLNQEKDLSAENIINERTMKTETKLKVTDLMVGD